MTQDCLNSSSIADVSKRLPKGIHVTGADGKSDLGIEGIVLQVWLFVMLLVFLLTK